MDRKAMFGRQKQTEILVGRKSSQVFRRKFSSEKIHATAADGNSRFCFVRRQKPSEKVAGRNSDDSGSRRKWPDFFLTTFSVGKRGQNFFRRLFPSEKVPGKKSDDSRREFLPPEIRKPVDPVCGSRWKTETY